MKKIGLIVIVLLVAAGGCVELGLFPGAGSGGGGFTPPTNGGNGGSGSVGDVLRVQLSASNTNPTLDEEVLLRCIVVEGSSTGVIFAFQPNSGRLAANPTAGTASFIVDASDISTAFRFTCTAQSASVSSDPSNQVLIIPTG